MARRLNRDSINAVRNPTFRACAETYLEVYDDFIHQVEQFGLPFAPDREAELAAEREVLSGCGLQERNAKESIAFFLTKRYTVIAKPEKIRKGASL